MNTRSSQIPVPGVPEIQPDGTTIIVRYMTWVVSYNFGVPTWSWNFDALPGGEWKTQFSVDVGKTWADTGPSTGGQTTNRAEVACFTCNVTPDNGYVRMVYIGPYTPPAV